MFGVAHLLKMVNLPMVQNIFRGHVMKRKFSSSIGSSVKKFRMPHPYFG
jgi:hypothetical protein